MLSCLKKVFNVGPSPINQHVLSYTTLLPVDIRLDRNEADHKEHEHSKGHHAEAKKDGSVLPDAGRRHQGPGPLSRSVMVPPSTPLQLLRCSWIQQFPVSQFTK